MGSKSRSSWVSFRSSRYVAHSSCAARRARWSRVPGAVCRPIVRAWTNGSGCGATAINGSTVGPQASAAAPNPDLRISLIKGGPSSCSKWDRGSLGNDDNPASDDDDEREGAVAHQEVVATSASSKAGTLEGCDSDDKADCKRTIQR